MTIQKLFKNRELQKKIFRTILLLVICRIGLFISIPGIDRNQVLHAFQKTTGESNTLFHLVDVFSGGAFSQMTIMALGIMPYISASIAVQLLLILFPALQREVKETPELGRRKVQKYTRFFTIVLSIVQAAAFALYALDLNQSYPGIISRELLRSTLFHIPIIFYAIVIVTMTTGTFFLMWMGEQISDRGIGNGISLLIGANVLSSFPSGVKLVIQKMQLESQERGDLSLFTLGLFFLIFVGIILSTVLIIQGQRKISLQYARRVVGRREVQGAGAAYLPLKVNYAGVIPVIFASALLMFPMTIARFLGEGGVPGWLSRVFSQNSTLYMISYGLLIVFFTYFWTATQFHPEQIVSEMRRGGAFIPGVKQGKATQKFLEETMSRVTFIGAFFLAFIALFPLLISRMFQIDPALRPFFGGTSLLILVGVILDTKQQIESHLLLDRYDRITMGRKTSLSR